MKSRFILMLLAATAMPAVRAAIVYSGVRNIPVPLTIEGEYLRPDTGQSVQTMPDDWEGAPWINPFFGGVYIGNSPLLRPVITGTDQILDLSTGTPVDIASNFASGESGSSTHVGSGPGQFPLGVPGYMGFAFRTAPGGPDYYGWMLMVINNTGPGTIVSWAYDDTAGASIKAGDEVPEPRTCAILGTLGLSALLRRRRGA